MRGYKCILAFGLTDEQLKKLKERRMKYKVVDSENAGSRLVDLLAGSDLKPSSNLPENEKALIFNGYNDKELKGAVTFIRRFVEGGVLAVVTENSEKWTFDYLLEHLIEEREFYKNQEE